MNVRLSAHQKIKVLNSKDIYSIMQPILLRENKIRRNQEHFWIVGLNNQNKILFIELVSLGATNRVQVAPPEVFRMAIYKLAVKLILVHNHPSGTTELSESDQELTGRLINAGEIVKVDVIDHLVITENKYLSFSDKGLLDKLKKNEEYELQGREKEIGIHFGRFKEKQELAMRMKRKGYSLVEIIELTGLKKTEISKLK